MLSGTNKPIPSSLLSEKLLIRLPTKGLAKNVFKSTTTSIEPGFFTKMKKKCLLLLLPFLSLAVSPAYASGMDGIANAGLILFGLAGAFLVSLIVGPLTRQYMAAKYLEIDLLKPSRAFGITIFEWILWFGSLSSLGNQIFPKGLVLPGLLGIIISVSMLLNFFVPQHSGDKQPVAVGQRLKYAAAVTLITFINLFLVSYVVARQFITPI